MRWTMSLGVLAGAITAIHARFSISGKPASFIVGMLIAACTHVGRTDEALQLFDQLTQHKIGPDLFTHVFVFSPLITACAREDRTDQVKRRRIAPSFVAFNALITACADGGRTDKALQVLEYGVELGVYPRGCAPSWAPK